MGDTGGASNMDHWAGLYGAPAAEATVVTAAAAATVSSPTSGGGSPSGGGAQQPGIEGGRVGKPARRRSRASRRAPVTLLNTDTSNFRAMVQQFTGIPSGGGPCYGPGGAGGPVISFRAAGSEYGASSSLPARPSPTPGAVMSFDHHHQLSSSSQQHRPPTSSLQGQQLFRPQPQHHQQQQYGYDSGDMSFLHGGFEPSSAEDRLLLQSIQAAQMMPTSSRPAAHSTTSNTNGYNFG